MSFFVLYRFLSLVISLCSPNYKLFSVTIYFNFLIMSRIKVNLNNKLGLTATNSAIQIENGKRKETTTQRKRRLEKAKQKRQEKLANETEEEKRIRLDKRKMRLQNESPEKREARLKTYHDRYITARSRETPLQREERLLADRVWHTQSRLNESKMNNGKRKETTAQRNRRLEKGRQYAKRKYEEKRAMRTQRQNESIEKCYQRLQQIKQIDSLTRSMKKSSQRSHLDLSLLPRDKRPVCARRMDSANALLAAHPAKEVVCPSCTCHFMGFPALQLHISKYHPTGPTSNEYSALDDPLAPRLSDYRFIEKHFGNQKQFVVKPKQEKTVELKIEYEPSGVSNEGVDDITIDNKLLLKDEICDLEDPSTALSEDCVDDYADGSDSSGHTSFHSDENLSEESTLTDRVLSESASRLVCFVCLQILPANLMSSHLVVKHSSKAIDITKCHSIGDPIRTDTNDGGERLKYKMSNALGDLLDRAVNNLLTAKQDSSNGFLCESTWKRHVLGIHTRPCGMPNVDDLPSDHDEPEDGGSQSSQSSSSGSPNKRQTDKKRRIGGSPNSTKPKRLLKFNGNDSVKKRAEVALRELNFTGLNKKLKL